MLKISKQICFFYLENRIKYMNRIIEECNIYPYLTDIFIHTNNVDLTESVFNKYDNGTIHIIKHTTFKNDNPLDYIKWIIDNYNNYTYKSVVFYSQNVVSIYNYLYHQKIKFNIDLNIVSQNYDNYCLVH